MFGWFRSVGVSPSGLGAQIFLFAYLSGSIRRKIGLDGSSSRAASSTRNDILILLEVEYHLPNFQYYHVSLSFRIDKLIHVFRAQKLMNASCNCLWALCYRPITGTKGRHESYWYRITFRVVSTLVHNQSVEDFRHFQCPVFGYGPYPRTLFAKR